MRLRHLGSVAAALALALGAASPALAADCYIVNRSDQGDAGASRSAVWVTVTVEGFAHSPEFPAGFDPDCFVDYWLSHGGPGAFTTRSDKVIGAGSANPNLANGKGLEHIEEAFGVLFGQALTACPA